MPQTINLENHFNEISNRGFCIVPVDLELTRALANQANLRLKNNVFKDATLSQSDVPNQQIRNDQILWLDAKKMQLEWPEIKILDQLANIKSGLSNYFRIHLSELECHYACYNTGHFYHRHADTTQVNNKRIFSFVIYLNENWLASDAGFLVGYEADEVLFNVKPEAGTMILFRSDIEHEVMITNRARLSLTGWFRK